jgi:hypothetical protein
MAAMAWALAAIGVVCIGVGAYCLVRAWAMW